MRREGHQYALLELVEGDHGVLAVHNGRLVEDGEVEDGVLILDGKLKAPNNLSLHDYSDVKQAITGNDCAN